MLHPDQVTQGLYWGIRQSIRAGLGIKKRKPEGSVLDAGIDVATARYQRVCSFYLEHLDTATEVKGGHVCEIGCGDCLASADLFLNLGARHVSLIEHLPTVTGDAQRAVLERCSRANGFGGMPLVLTAAGALDEGRVTKIAAYLEDIRESTEYDLMVSFDVLEHVEDVESFFGNCHRMLRAGGRMLHKIDLSGHGVFEDPLPPLDFQTYPDWLYALIYPKYRRATRRTRDEYLEAMRGAGFVVEEVGYLTEAQAPYVEELRPRLRRPLREMSWDQLKALDWFVKARKA